MITIGAVVLLHLGVIAVLVGVNGCRTTSGFEKPGDLSAYTGVPGAGASAPAAAPAPAGLNEPAAPAAPRAAKVGHGGTYTVVRGDSLWLVARREGVSLAALAAANGIEVNAVLREGQKLAIPSADFVAPAPKADAPAAGAAPAAPAPRSSLAAPEGGFGGFGTSAPAPAAPAAPAPAAPAAPAPAAPASGSSLAAPEGGFGGFGSGQR